MHYGLYLGMVMFGHPEKEVSIGLHEKVGPCDQKSVVYTATGGVSQFPLCIFKYSVCLVATNI